ncbi:hypothetical protein A8926_1441 [Saccharopolyspora spinosa]|uniref:NAD(P)-binding protein n=1 Tax=Saccharopolyspora spinosa TaxID=60894 RepID=A0A2N3XT63_SACSN|nr:hypothetical protein A8926_1441 [Saccharopolyspora spinosa]
MSGSRRRAVARVISRDPAAVRLPEQVEIVRGDLAGPPASVLDGISKVFRYPDRGGVGGFLDDARAAGVEHLVLLSANVVTVPGGSDLRWSGCTRRPSGQCSIPGWPGRRTSADFSR